jgi:hypothetical protein
MLAVSPSSAALVRRSCFTDLSFDAAFDLLAGPLLLRSPGGIGGILLVMIKNPCGKCRWPVAPWYIGSQSELGNVRYVPFPDSCTFILPFA